MIQFDAASLRRYEKQLTAMYEKALPVARRLFVNDQAFAIAAKAKKNVKDKMITRNTWTIRTIQVEKARGTRKTSEVGSTQEYMYDQEFGKTEVKKGRHGVAIPTGWSAGQRGQAKRTRLPRLSNTMRKIKLQKRLGGKLKSRRQRNLMLVHAAVKSKRRFVYMDLGRRQGIFKVIGGRTSTRSIDNNRVKGAQVQMVHDLSHKTITIPPTPWLWPAVEAEQPRAARRYGRRLLEQIRRQRTFRR